MRHLLRLTDWAVSDLRSLFRRADQYRAGHGPEVDACAVLVFPPTSLRTRVSFERGARLMGIQPITFPPETLDAVEHLADVAGYLAEWADLMVVRHPDITVLDRLAAPDALPVINAMTSVNHPCEVLSDLYALSQQADPLQLRYLIVAPDGNIARAWWEAAQAFGLDVMQSCPEHLAVPGMIWTDNLPAAVAHADVIITDGPGNHTEAMAPFRITAELLDLAPASARFAPCPPFVRGREVSAGAITHPTFVGYQFKSALLPVQQALMSLAIEEKHHTR